MNWLRLSLVGMKKKTFVTFYLIWKSNLSRYLAIRILAYSISMSIIMVVIFSKAWSQIGDYSWLDLFSPKDFKRMGFAIPFMMILDSFQSQSEWEMEKWHLLLLRKRLVSEVIPPSMPAQHLMALHLLLMNRRLLASSYSLWHITWHLAKLSVLSLLVSLLTMIRVLVIQRLLPISGTEHLSA